MFMTTNIHKTVILLLYCTGVILNDIIVFLKLCFDKNSFFRDNREIKKNNVNNDCVAHI